MVGAPRQIAGGVCARRQQGEPAAREAPERIARLGADDRRGEPLVEQRLVEREGGAEPGIGEVAPGGAVAQQRFGALAAERHQRFGPVEKEEHGVTVGITALDRARHRPPVVPPDGRRGVAGGGEQVATIEHGLRVERPRHGAQAAVDRRRRVRRRQQSCAEPRRDRSQRAKHSKLGGPRVGDHQDIGQRPTGIAGQHLLVRRRPRHRLDIDRDAGRAGEARQQQRRVLALGAHRPPRHPGGVARLAAGANDHGRRGSQRTAPRNDRLAVPVGDDASAPRSLRAPRQPTFAAGSRGQIAAWRIGIAGRQNTPSWRKAG